MEIIYFPSSKTSVKMPSFAAKALRSCSMAGTLAEHASALSTSGASLREIRQTLTQLVHCRAIIPVHSVLDEPSESNTSLSAEINVIAIPTLNRLAELERAISTYCLNSRAFGRMPRFLIVDSAPDDYAGSARALTLHLRHSLPCGIHYAGAEEKRRYAVALAAEAEIPVDIVQFALFGIDVEQAPRMGANRNAILLHTSGTPVLSVDDDTVCRAGKSPSSLETSRLRIGKDGDPNDYWFFESAESVADFTRWDDLDVIGEHEQFLGRSVRGLAAQWPRSLLDMDQACPHLWAMLCRDSGKICVTYNGVAGDSAIHSGWLPQATHSPGTRQRLIGSEAAWRLASESRQVLRHTPSVVIGHCEPCIGMCLGLDNRELLPPFFPVGRNEDGIFGKITERSIPGACAAHLPWSIAHSPPCERFYQTDAAARYRISDVILACVSGWSGLPSSRTTAQALQSLGRHFLELGGLGASALREELRHELWKTASMRIQWCEALLAKYPGSPDFWVNGVLREIRLIREGMTNPDFLVPCDLPFSPEDAPARICELILQFGRLLVSWPIMIEASKRLRNRGVELGVLL